MRILVVGSGGREHTLAWSLLQSPEVDRVFCAPGNGGTALLANCQNLAVQETDFAAIAKACQTENIALVVVGPEVPLALGITDYLQAQGIAVFGPNQEGAQLEASKAWAKTLMEEAGISTARSATFYDATSAKAYVKEKGAPIVVKADGLAAGKGVTVAATVAEAEAAIETAFEGQFGEAGKCLVIEECLVGVEVSVLALTDGKTIRPLVPAQDHKRIGEGDRGPNTGGMGAYAPAPLVTPVGMSQIEQTILQPTLRTLQKRNIDYRGVIYVGLMITNSGDFKVIEFNCRFGDPETQVILPLLETPLLDLIQACVEQRLATEPEIVWKPRVSACVVAASAGYPGSYQKGKLITGLAEAAAQPETLVFQAGVQMSDRGSITSGGRVLGVTALGNDFDQAFGQAYTALQMLHFEGIYYRQDIGYQVRSRS